MGIGSMMKDAMLKAKSMRAAKSLEKPKMESVEAAPAATALVKPVVKAVQTEMSKPKEPSTPPDRKPMSRAFTGLMRGIRGF